MLITINAIIFIITSSPIWVSITFIKALGYFLLYLAKSALIFFIGIYGLITSYDSFNIYRFINYLLESLFQMFSKSIATFDDFYPSFWEFAKYESPMLAFFIWFIFALIAMFND